jgi:HPt (histidine-containing phosphotransfer) domain-containing protein
VRNEVTDPSGHLLRFEVQDTGIGIPQEVAKGLFQAFTQADATTTRRFGGTGLGLSISKRLAELMGGEIGLQSKPGAGSTFWFTIRVRPGAATSAVRSEADKNPGVWPESTRVLVVEDNPINQKVASKQLAKFGLRVEIAGTGMKALEMLAKPMRMGELEAVLIRWLGDGAAAEANPVLDPSVLSDLKELGGDGGTSLIEELGRMFISYCPERIRKMRSSLEKGDLAAVRKEAHQLKSSSGNFGALAFSRLCQSLEDLGAEDSPARAGDLLNQLETEYARVSTALEKEFRRAA